MSIETVFFFESIFHRYLWQAVAYFDQELYVYFERNREVETHVGYGPSGLGRNQVVTHNFS